MERPEGRRRFVNPTRRWEDNIKMNIQEVEGGMSWIDLVQDRDRWQVIVNAVINLPITKANEMRYFSNLFFIKNSTCFGQIYCPSSEVSTLYTQ